MFAWADASCRYTQGASHHANMLREMASSQMVFSITQKCFLMQWSIGWTQYHGMLDSSLPLLATHLMPVGVFAFLVAMNVVLCSCMQPKKDAVRLRQWSPWWAIKDWWAMLEKVLFHDVVRWFSILGFYDLIWWCRPATFESILSITWCHHMLYCRRVFVLPIHGALCSYTQPEQNASLLHTELHYQTSRLLGDALDNIFFHDGGAWKRIVSPILGLAFYDLIRWCGPSNFWSTSFCSLIWCRGRSRTLHKAIWTWWLGLSLRIEALTPLSLLLVLFSPQNFDQIYGETGHQQEYQLLKKSSLVLIVYPSIIGSV